jgi:hypothetical protein
VGLVEMLLVTSSSAAWLSSRAWGRAAVGSATPSMERGNRLKYRWKYIFFLVLFFVRLDAFSGEFSGQSPMQSFARLIPFCRWAIPPELFLE